MKMVNKVEWKKSSIDYNKLNEVSHADLIRIENGKKTITENSSFEGRSKGGQTNIKTGHISNLGKEWGSIIGKKYGKENIKKAQGLGAKAMANLYSEEIYQMDLNDNIIKKWNSMNDAKRAGYHAGHISECCNGKKKQYRGCKWRFVN